MLQEEALSILPDARTAVVAPASAVVLAVVKYPEWMVVRYAFEREVVEGRALSVDLAAQEVGALAGAQGCTLAGTERRARGSHPAVQSAGCILHTNI